MSEEMDEVRALGAALSAVEDQVQAALKNRARLLGAFRKSLVAEGFTEQQAFCICRDWQADSLLDGDGE